MKNLTGIIIGILVVIAVIIGALYYKNNKTTNEYGSPSSTSGNLYVGVTDATANINNVSEVDLSVKKVEVHSQSKGWVNVSSSEKKFGLLALKASGEMKLYAKNELKAGSYDRVRVTLGDVTVRTKTKGDVKAVLPSRQIVVNVTLKVKGDSDSHLKLDFLADKSLHTTTSGSFVFAPVVKVESRSDTEVTVASDDSEDVSEGTVDDDVSVGMDLDGSSKEDFQLNTDNTLKVNSLFGNQINFMLGGKTYTSDNSEVQENEMDSDSDVKIDLNTNGSSNSGSSSTNSGLDANVNLGY